MKKKFNLNDFEHTLAEKLSDGITIFTKVAMCFAILSAITILVVFIAKIRNGYVILGILGLSFIIMEIYEIGTKYIKVKKQKEDNYNNNFEVGLMNVKKGNKSNSKDLKGKTAFGITLKDVEEMMKNLPENGCSCPDCMANWKEQLKINLTFLEQGEQTEDVIKEEKRIRDILKRLDDGYKLSFDFA